MQFGLSGEALALIRDVFRKYPEVSHVKIYGSRARGDYRAGSDIDLALFCGPEKKDVSSLISWDLEELPLPYLFDVADYSRLAAGPLKKEIDSAGRTLYAKSGAKA